MRNIESSRIACSLVFRLHKYGPYMLGQVPVPILKALSHQKLESVFMRVYSIAMLGQKSRG
jgi:hypothetical protein